MKVNSRAFISLNQALSLITYILDSQKSCVLLNVKSVRPTRVRSYYNSVHIINSAVYIGFLHLYRHFPTCHLFYPIPRKIVHFNEYKIVIYFRYVSSDSVSDAVFAILSELARVMTAGIQ